MIVTVYDYRDLPTRFCLPDKKIVLITVEFCSGDENATVYFEDGAALYLRAAECFYPGDFEPGYPVMGDDIDKWISFIPSGEGCPADERASLFVKNIPDAELLEGEEE